MRIGQAGHKARSAVALGLTLWIAGSALVSGQDASHQPSLNSSEAHGDEAPFLKDNDAAMTKMMTDMAAKPTGDVDRDFVAMMVPHHQGAIDMAMALLKYGRNEQLKRLAQEIIVTQQQEIAAMRLAVGDSLPPSRPTRAAVSEQH